MIPSDLETIVEILEPDRPATAEESSTADIIGEILVRGKLISPEQLRHARRIQKKLATSKTILSVLEELRFATSD